ncbi:MAG: DNA polymerase III subunit gamma/tau [Motiliproteus sp.]
MSYQVLARKWRPSTFEAMVGQDHVLQALVNALDSNRLHHAYLFTGTRGVGKTSIARLFAKALNCEQGVSSKPCGQCSPCREISEGRFVDLIEVDAASRTKVEDTRELMDNVQYAPTQGRYKVYLIDEVHMLSTHSFNALLKTLEEPPPHIKFLLATTDPQKLPMTILSRCLQFNLKNMVPEKIVNHLQHVLQAEQIPFEDNALWLLARAANGSMRDAMSLTDQGIAFGSGQLLDADIQSMLGSVDQRQVAALLQQLAQGSAAGVLATVADMAQFGADSDAILAELLGLLHRVGIAQMLPEAVDNSQGDREATLALAGQLRAEDVQLFYQIAINGRRDLPHVPVAREGLEMTLLRMLAFRPVLKGEVALPDLSAAISVGAEAAEAPSIAVPAADAITANTLPVNSPVAPVSEPSASAPAEATLQPSSATTTPNPPTDPLAAQSPVASNQAAPHQAAALDDTPPWASGADTDPGYGARGSLEPDARDEPLKKPEAPAADEPDLSTPNAASIPAVDSAGSTAPSDSEPATAFERSSSVSSEQQTATETIVPEVVSQSAPVASEDSIAAPETAVDSPAETGSIIEQGEAGSRKSIEVTHGGALAVRWVGLIDQIGLTGMTYNIAANASLRSVESNRWCFTLTSQQLHLFNTTHQQRLAQALSDHLGEVINIEVMEVAAGAASESETPAQYQERKRQERQRLAVKAIESDPEVQTIIANYDARIDPSSIKPIDNGEPVR